MFENFLVCPIPLTSAVDVQSSTILPAFYTCACLYLCGQRTTHINSVLVTTHELVWRFIQGDCRIRFKSTADHSLMKLEPVPQTVGSGNESVKCSKSLTWRFPCGPYMCSVPRNSMLASVKSSKFSWWNILRHLQHNWKRTSAMLSQTNNWVILCQMKFYHGNIMQTYHYTRLL